MLRHHARTNAGPSGEYTLKGDLVCWTKMQAEAGQPIGAIIARKEIERQAGEGLFTWGVGNAPAVLINTLARLEQRVPVLFSLMKSKPKLVDVSPATTLVWRRYIDRHGYERELPPSAIVTSRGGEDWRNKRHYALMCYSASALEIRRGQAFDPAAFRNASGTGAPVGASQVTSLLRQVEIPSAKADYEVNLRADLVGSYWVRLTDPALLSAAQIEALADLEDLDRLSWLALARDIRSQPPRSSGDRLFI